MFESVVKTEFLLILLTLAEKLLDWFPIFLGASKAKALGEKFRQNSYIVFPL